MVVVFQWPMGEAFSVVNLSTAITEPQTETCLQSESACLLLLSSDFCVHGGDTREAPENMS